MSQYKNEKMKSCSASIVTLASYRQNSLACLITLSHNFPGKPGTVFSKEMALRVFAEPISDLLVATSPLKSLFGSLGTSRKEVLKL